MTANRFMVIIYLLIIVILILCSVLLTRLLSKCKGKNLETYGAGKNLESQNCQMIGCEGTFNLTIDDKIGGVLAYFAYPSDWPSHGFKRTVGIGAPKAIKCPIPVGVLIYADKSDIGSGIDQAGSIIAVKYKDSANNVYIGVQGTISLTNNVTMDKNIACGDAKGWATLNDVCKNLLKFIGTDNIKVISGHSLGGAICLWLYTSVGGNIMTKIDKMVLVNPYIGVVNYMERFVKNIKPSFNTNKITLIANQGDPASAYWRLFTSKTCTPSETTYSGIINSLNAMLNIGGALLVGCQIPRIIYQGGYNDKTLLRIEKTHIHKLPDNNDCSTSRLGSWTTAHLMATPLDSTSLISKIGLRKCSELPAKAGVGLFASTCYVGDSWTVCDPNQACYTWTIS